MRRKDVLTDYRGTNKNKKHTFSEANETTGNMMKNGKGYQIKQTRRFRQDVTINDGLWSRDENFQC